MTTNQQPSRAYAALCKAAGLPIGTNADVALAAFAGKQARAAVAKLTDLTRPVAAFTAPEARHNGVRLLNAEEAQDALNFGVTTDADRRRVTATEDRFGKSLHAILQDGDLR